MYERAPAPSASIPRPAYEQLCAINAHQYALEMVEGIRLKQETELFQRWREAKILLVDDLQYLVGKEATQDSFCQFIQRRIDEQKITLLFSACPLHLFEGNFKDLVLRWDKKVPSLGVLLKCKNELEVSHEQCI